MRNARLIPFAAALGAIAVLGCGCATTLVTPEPVDEPPPASSAAAAVQRFAWGFNHKDVEVVRGLLTDDFQFITAGLDSAGNPDRVPVPNVPNVRAWFLAALAAMSDSSSSMSMVLDRNLVAFPDTRAGKAPRFHKQIRSSADVRVRFRAPDGHVEVTGNLLFFVTRGDSAAIPADLIGRGFKPDSTRWWLDRIEDETLVGAAAVSSATQPSGRITFGLLLEYFYSLVAR
jgi:hypothetical protein